MSTPGRRSNRSTELSARGTFGNRIGRGWRIGRDAHLHLAQALIRQGKLDLGIDAYREAIHHAPQLLAALNGGRASVLVGVPRLYAALLTGIKQRVTGAGGLRGRGGAGGI